MHSTSVKNSEHSYAEDAMQPRDHAMFLQVHQPLESPEASSVSYNSLQWACSEEKSCSS